MTRDEIREAARRHAERTRREQGLPAFVEDSVVLDRVATLLLGADRA